MPWSYRFNETGLLVSDCANWALGMWTYIFGAFKIEPFVDGFPPWTARWTRSGRA